MNVIEYKADSLPICFCIVDNTHLYTSSWSRELIKNQADFSISNIHSKAYDVFQSQDEDALLHHVSNLNYTHAVVFSTGTEFINGRSFFSAVEELVKTDFFIAGHILDRKEAYYELHHQCYVINLSKYKELGCPAVGKQDLGSAHKQLEPMRSVENIHDDYTPTHISCGAVNTQYSHKMHGWNILSTAFANNFPVVVFNAKIRNNKKHYYPENQTEFLKHVQWAYQRYNYCSTEFVHKEHTEEITATSNNYDQIITPASGNWFLSCVGSKPLHVIMYDYNEKSLEYWQQNVPAFPNVTYEFIKTDLLTSNIEELIKNTEQNTLFNITNIFCYEGTAMFYSLEYRLRKELELMSKLPSNWTLMSSERSWTGFANSPTCIKDLKKPTWHIGDWNE